MAELVQLLDREIPEGRQTLQESYSNLESVAQYCQENYLQAADKRKALEETKNFTTHSLASVAYQINNLATNFLKLLDLQQNQLAEMESNVNHLSQTVAIHKEKVARREIGVLTTNRSTTRPLGVKNGIIFPSHGEEPTKYKRKAIDYSALDEIGHGVKLPETTGLIRSQSNVSSSQKTRTPSVSSQGSSPAPTTRPPTPPQNRTGSLGRSQPPHMQQPPQGPYRTPAPAVAPPTVPSQYASMQQQIQQQRSGYLPTTPGVMGQIHTPVGMAQPMSRTSMGPPPPSPGTMQQARVSHTSQLVSQSSIDSLPPPPASMADGVDDMAQNDPGSPPLPPPPPQQESPGMYNTSPAPPPPQFEDQDGQDDVMPPPEDDPYATTGPDLMRPDWVPTDYMEKVIAIYDYIADKDDELSFSENSVIYVIKKNDDGWWEGVLNGETGLFPGNYVEPCI